jgi:hypothetical protein
MHKKAWETILPFLVKKIIGGEEIHGIEITIGEWLLYNKHVSIAWVGFLLSWMDLHRHREYIPEFYFVL